MPRGTLEILLADAKGLENTDFLSNMDPYCILTYRSQEKKSSIKSGAGSNPEWNETFLFTVSDNSDDLRIKIMDSDHLTQDDFVGEATIPLEAVLNEGDIAPMTYNVFKNKKHCGEICIGLSFTRERGYARGLPGGWRESS